VYALTATGLQLQFRCDLQDVVDAIPQDELLVLLGDLNARVGVMGPDEESWQGVLGRHRLNDRNEAGKEVLQFCAMNQFTVMNTWFRKKSIHYGTWRHPDTNLSHVIDLVMTSENTMEICVL